MISLRVYSRELCCCVRECIQSQSGYRPPNPPEVSTNETFSKRASECPFKYTPLWSYCPPCFSDGHYCAVLFELLGFGWSWDRTPFHICFWLSAFLFWWVSSVLSFPTSLVRCLSLSKKFVRVFYILGIWMLFTDTIPLFDFSFNLVFGDDLIYRRSQFLCIQMYPHFPSWFLSLHFLRKPFLTPELEKKYSPLLLFHHFHLFIFYL